MTDVSAPYMARRAELGDAGAIDELEQFAGASKDAQPGPGGTPAAPAAAVPATSEAPPQGSLTGRVAKDVGTGIVETPRAIFTGVRDAYNNTLQLADDLGGWLEENNLGGGIIIDSNGVRFASGKELSDPNLVRPADYARLPHVMDNPKSVTGGLVKGVAQFLVGMKGAGKLAEIANVPEATGAAGYALTALKGAVANFTAFDPHQQRLSNLIEKFPALQNPVTEFLASKPEDNAAEGRLKNALEGLGLGVLTDGLFRAVKLARSAMGTKAAATDAMTQIAPQAASDEIGKLLTPDVPEGTPAGSAPPEPPLVVNPRAQAAAEKLTAAVTRTAPIAPDDVVGRMAAPLEPVASSVEGRAAEPARTFINFAHVDTPEDVQKVMQTLADKIPLSADTARAGVRTFEDMKLDAAHQNAWEALASRASGEPLSDAKMLSARQLWASATDKVAQLAQEAATSPSEANLFAFRKMLAVHSMIQDQVLGARAAIARAQASMRIPVGSSAEKLRDIKMMLEQQGGNDVTRELAQAIDKMAQQGMLSELGETAAKGWGARTVDAVKEAWTLGLLTSPKTHLRNIVSNAAFMPMQFAERAMASKVRGFLGDAEGVQAGEAAAQYYGTTQAIKDMFRYYGQLARARILDSDSLDAVRAQNPINETGIKDASKIELPPAISSEALQIPADSWLGKAADGLGSLYGLTSKALTAEDNFFKVTGYRAETYAQAFRQARQEIASGALTEENAPARMADLIANPPENIRMAAVDQALYQTFNQAPGWFGQLLLKAKRNSLLAHVLIPFARTTANLQRAAFERTPLAPFVGQWRADFMAGGARQQMAIARWTLGTAATMAVIDATTSGMITGKGPADPGQRQALAREGWRPYSWKIGDRWYQYNGISPVGDQIGMAADLAEIAMHGSDNVVDGKDIEKVSLASVAAMAGNMMNKSYLSGFSGAIEAINDPTGHAAQWARQMAGSVVPSGLNVVRQAVDPNVREVNSMLDAIRARVPGLSDSLPVKRDLWGQPMQTDSGFGKPFDLFSPIYSQKPTAEPIDQEILRLGANVTMPPPTTSFKGVNVDLRLYPDAYQRYVQLAGNELKNPAWNKGAKDFLNDVVTGKSPLSVVYRMKSDGAEGQKASFIEDTVRRYRELAREQLLKEYPKLAMDVRQKQAQQRELKLPVMQ